MQTRVEERSIRDLGRSMELLLSGPTTTDELEKATKMAIQYNMRTFLCEQARAVHEAKRLLEGSDVQIGTGVSFPDGRDLPELKAYAAAHIAKLGADDVEVVMNYNALLRGDLWQVEEEVRLVREVLKGKEFKLIIEVCKLTDAQIRNACEIAIENGVDFIKSSTGRLQGPTLEQACIIVDMTKGTNTHSKVSGVKFPRPQNALAFLSAGIECIGSQGCVEILEGIRFMRQRGIVPGPVD